VRAHRLRLDPNAAAGVPEHITLISPFIPPERLDTGVRVRLASLFASVHPFPFELTSVGWFGDQVMWLAPEPAAPFVELTQRLVDEFGIQPYEGAYADIRPHLTVALGNPEGAREAAAAVAPRLPVRALADRVHLMVGAEATGWSLLEEYRFCSRA
jgi:2'-5' RNA ligase